MVYNKLASHLIVLLSMARKCYIKDMDDGVVTSISSEWSNDLKEFLDNWIDDINYTNEELSELVNYPVIDIWQKDSCICGNKFNDNRQGILTYHCTVCKGKYIKFSRLVDEINYRLGCYEGEYRYIINQAWMELLILRGLQ